MNLRTKLNQTYTEKRWLVTLLSNGRVVKRMVRKRVRFEILAGGVLGNAKSLTWKPPRRGYRRPLQVDGAILTCGTMKITGVFERIATLHSDDILRLRAGDLTVML